MNMHHRYAVSATPQIFDIFHRPKYTFGMKIRKAFTYRLKPNIDQKLKMSMFSGCCRYLWNHSLSIQRTLLDQSKKILSYIKLASFLKDWKRAEATSFLKESHSQILQQTLKNLDRALRNGLKKKKGMPKFKKKYRHDSFNYPQGFKIEGKKIFLPKIGWMRFRKSREIEGTPKNVTVSRRGIHWYVSVQVEIEISQPKHTSASFVGIDMGIARFATLSTGEFFSPINSFRVLEKKLAKKQNVISRKQKFSKNWKKQKVKVQQIHIKIANARKDFLHKISTQISKSHAVVVIEDLKISNMSRSAKGTVENPGKQVKGKSGLNKSILDQGWHSFRKMLEYKLLWLGGHLIEVNPRNSSRTCPECKYVHADNRKTQAMFLCLKCEYSENADYVASLNILAAGTAVVACGDFRNT